MFNIAGNSASTGYNINNSLRFRASASAYLSRTPASASNRTTWTWSVWVKRSNIGQQGFIFAANTSSIGNLQDTLEFEANDTLQYYSVLQGTGVNAQLATTQVFRDPSAWYHIVIAVDTTQATSSNRIKLYVNGSQVTAFSTATYPSLNYNTGMNAAVPNVIGKPNTGTYFDGYQTELNFIDGQALTPSSFGSTDATTGVWVPKKYTGTYGTNGYYINFSDTSALTTSSNVGLGKDYSGNGNYYTTNNISITAGVTYDAMKDSPTLTSATVANYAVLNPVATTTAGSVIDGNLKTSGADKRWYSSIGVDSGKWYFEWNIISTNLTVGIANDLSAQGANYNGSRVYHNNGNKRSDSTSSAYGATYTAGDVIGCALDLDAGTLTFYKNNVSQGTAFTGLTGTWYAGCDTGASGVACANFGQRPFTYTPPSGFVALNTYNLPTPTILKGNKYMDATLYTGTGSSLSVTNSSSFKPDLVWIKSRSGAFSHNLNDSNRGVLKVLQSDTTGAEANLNGAVSAFNSNGFSVATGSSGIAEVSNNGSTYVGWQWQAGQGSSSSNTSGTITSTVSVNASAGFSIVTWTGNGTAGATVGHGLGVNPSMIIIKNRSLGGAGQNWLVWHKSISQAIQTSSVITLNGYTGAIYLNFTNASSTYGFDSQINGSSNLMLAYAWAEIAGFSKFGSYTGNGSVDGTFIYTGFKPKFILVKETSALDNWVIWDTIRNPYNSNDVQLSPNVTTAEGNAAITGNPIDILSNGFKQRTIGARTNGSGATYIYAAFAENPFKNSNAF